MVLGHKATGKLVTPKPKCQPEPRPCMVFGLKSVGKLVTPRPKC